MPFVHFLLFVQKAKAPFLLNINIKADTRFSLKRNEIKHEQILYENIYATQK